MRRFAQRLAVVGVVGLTAISPVLAGSPTGGEGGVTIQTFQFQPFSHEVKAGARVAWTNGDDILHTVTSGTPERPDGRFHSPLDGKGATYSITFSDPGTYPYFCNRHRSMRGEIVVTKSGK
jgi:plastocyanin